MNDGKFVRCLVPTPDCKGPHNVHRGLCFTGPYPECGTCPHHHFDLRLRQGAGHEIVACPRWSTETVRLYGRPPEVYVMVRRELCFTARPFPWCPSCPNQAASETPRDEPGWYEREQWWREYKRREESE